MVSNVTGASLPKVMSERKTEVDERASHRNLRGRVFRARGQVVQRARGGGVSGLTRENTGSMNFR